MTYLADLHIHSSYSRSTSRDISLETLSAWARLKGVNVIGTGDFTHPAWFGELTAKLRVSDNGFYVLNNCPAEAAPCAGELCGGEVFFVPTAEISCIYKRGGRTRRAHHLLVCDSLESAGKIGAALAKIGNVRSDGRPILGLDSEKLLEIVLEAGEENLLIPAHAWTPHFSIFGSFSGFDSLEDCFGCLAPRVMAIETGLSSDPAMNRRISFLDSVALISCSDAHSPQKIGREATEFSGEPTLAGMLRAITSGGAGGILRTIEYFSEEGKYHHDGHRACGVRLAPEQTREAGGRCPSCGGKITVGVLSRVEQLADRSERYARGGFPPFEPVIPLIEILSEVMSVGVQSKKLMSEYFRLIHEIGNEFYILLHAPVDEIRGKSTALLAEAIRRARAGEVSIQPGYDGEFGIVRLFNDEDRRKF